MKEAKNGLMQAENIDNMHPYELRLLILEKRITSIALVTEMLSKVFADLGKHIGELNAGLQQQPRRGIYRNGVNKGRASARFSHTKRRK